MDVKLDHIRPNKFPCSQIITGKQKYFCSICFISNPSSIAFDAKKFNNSSISSGSTLQITATTRAISIPTPIVPVIKFACTNCDFVTETNENLTQHEKDKHWFKCTDCNKVFTSEDEKLTHVTKEHETQTNPCGKCDKSFVMNRDETNCV